MPEEEERENEQVRVRFRLAAECKDEALEIPDTEMAIPSHLGRKGLSTVINHLLDRRAPEEDDEGDGDEDRLPALTFDFLVGKDNFNRLLRTSIEKEARQNGLSLENALVVTYFPSQQAPEAKEESQATPDWISDLSFASETLTVACYEGSLRHYSVGKGGILTSQIVAPNAHSGPVKCTKSFTMAGSLWTVSGSMDHSMALTSWPSGRCHARMDHQAAVVSIDERIGSSDSSPLLASGDWDGGVCLWKLDYADAWNDNMPSKKRKKNTSTDEEGEIDYILTKTVSVQAHQSKVGGVCWGNHAKVNGFTDMKLITGSWDHSIKVYDMESQDCLLTLNGSKVVSSIDTSYFTAGIVATGHPDCAIRLWDVRTDQTTNSLVSDTSFRPSHRAWVSQVKWSSSNPYQLFSASHDGTVKVWDIRAQSPLHTVRAAPKDQKLMSIVVGSVDGESILFTGGTDCEVKQYTLDSKELS
jgi:ribosome biogenesis protein YTM1